MTITVAQLVSALELETIDRGTFYLYVYDLTGSEAALLQAHVSMFSGTVGGVGIAANYLLTDGARNTTEGINNDLGLTGYFDNPENEIYTLSQLVALDYGLAVSENISEGGTGKRSKGSE